MHASLGEESATAAHAACPLTESSSSPHACSGLSSVNAPTPAYTVACSEDDSDDEVIGGHGVEPLVCHPRPHHSHARSHSRSLPCFAALDDGAAEPAHRTNLRPLPLSSFTPAGTPGVVVEDAEEAAAAGSMSSEGVRGGAATRTDEPPRAMCRRAITPVVKAHTVVFAVPTLPPPPPPPLTPPPVSPSQACRGESWHRRSSLDSAGGGAGGSSCDVRRFFCATCGVEGERDETEMMGSPLSTLSFSASVATPFASAAADACSVRVTSPDGECAAPPALCSTVPCGGSANLFSPNSSAATFVDYGAEVCETALSAASAFDSALSGSYAAGGSTRGSRDGGARIARVEAQRASAAASRADSQGSHLSASVGRQQQRCLSPSYTAEYAIAVSEAAKYRWSVREALAARLATTEEEEELFSGDDL